jgi:hypothetical protein
MHLRLSVLLVAFVAALSLGVTTASATGGVTRVHFTASFGDGLFVCSGTRIVKPGPGGFVKDEETCLVQQELVPTRTYSLAEANAVAPWCSDFEGTREHDPYCRVAIAGWVAITANGNGTYTWKINAYYQP